MKYSATNYAQALTELASRTHGVAEQDKLVRNFWSAVEKNGDLGKRSKIVAEAERLLRRADSLALWEVETARPLRIKAQDILKGIAKPKDVVRETVNPELVAGVRITKNGEEQLDATLKHRLDALFQS